MLYLQACENHLSAFSISSHTQQLRVRPQRKHLCQVSLDNRRGRSFLAFASPLTRLRCTEASSGYGERKETEITSKTSGRATQELWGNQAEKSKNKQEAVGTLTDSSAPKKMGRGACNTFPGACNLSIQGSSLMDSYKTRFRFSISDPMFSRCSVAVAMEQVSLTWNSI